MEKKLFERWLSKVDDPEIKAELESFKDDANEIKERFYSELSFGTAGLRGVLGAGSNRMNIYTVGRATAGLAKYLVENYENPTMVIARDTRNKSDKFAKITAEILARAGVKVYFFPLPTAVPILSFAIRELKTSGGVCITASHNPAKYNGYKAYGPDGAQLSPDDADIVTGNIALIDIFDGVAQADFDEAVADGKIIVLGDEIMNKYLDIVYSQAQNPGICEKAPIKVVYTPLNGAGNKPVREILSRIGVSDLAVVPEQENPDGNFPTCPYPNPEIEEAMKLGLNLCEKTGADLLIATDPDADRCGIAIRRGDSMQLMSGNEVGVMLLNYILEAKKKNGVLPQKPIAVSTIVSTPLTARVGADYGCEVINVLTGFKFIGGEIEKLAVKGEEDRFMLGFEESYGYLVGNYARDKDSIVAAMLICEMAAFYKNMGKSLFEVMDDIYKKYGYYINTVISLEFAGMSGMEKMNAIMENFRNNPPSEIDGHKVLKVTDLIKGIDLPPSNVIIFDLEDNFKAIARPSGTEPKLKIYLTAVAKERTSAVAAAESLGMAMKKLTEV